MSLDDLNEDRMPNVCWTVVSANGNPLKEAKFEGQKRMVLEIIPAFYKSFND